MAPAAPPSDQRTHAGRDPVVDDAARHVLLIEDDAIVSAAIAEALTSGGFEVMQAATGAAGQAAALVTPFDLVLLDVGLPDTSGFEVCANLRQSSAVPIIFLTALTELDDRLRGFDLGADDYIQKPFEMTELVRRVRAVLQRTPRASGRSLYGPSGLVLDLQMHEIRIGDRVVACSAQEFDILKLLLGRRGEAISADEFAESVWGHRTFGERNFVEAAVSRLRAKLAAAGVTKLIETIRGVGYVVRR